MRRFVYVARGVAWRSIHNTLANPAILLPSIDLPAVLPRRVRRRPVEDRRRARTSTTRPATRPSSSSFVFLQSAAFGGVFTGFAVARDFDSGFARRLLLSAPRRSGIIAGYALGALGALAAHRDRGHDRRADRRDERRRQRRRTRRPARPRHRDEPRRRAVGLRRGDVPAHRTGRRADPDARVRRCCSSRPCTCR